jgi:hypothetical protein
VDGIGAGTLRNVEELARIEVALARRVAADRVRLVCVRRVE